MKVFVSSVMKGFEAERAAARRAIELLRLEPVMAENFGAKPHSSEIACVEEVRGSDVYVVVLGTRYGFVAPSGKSVTEEEFEAARARGLRVLVFASRDAKEPQQEEFLRRLGDYREGYFLAKYSTPNELQDAIVQALNDLVRGRGEGIAPTAAARLIEQRLTVFKERRGDSPSLVVGVTPAEALGEILSPMKLGDSGFHDELRQLLLFGKPRHFFNAKLGTETREEVTHVEFVQLGPRRDDLKNAAAFFSDGSLATFADLENERSGGYSLIDGALIDRNRVQEQITASLQLGAAYYGLVNDRRLTEFYVWSALRNIGQRQYGVIPSEPVNSMSMPMHSLGPTLWVPTEPQRLSLQALEDATGVAADVVERLARIFRAANAYFTHRH